MRTEHKSSTSPAIPASIDTYSITSRKDRDRPSHHRPENTGYQIRSPSVDVVQHVHPATALGQSIPMAAGQDSQIAPLTASIDDVRTRIETIAETIQTHLTQDAPERVRDKIRDWSESRGTDQPFVVTARYAAVNLLLKATLYEWYTHRGDLPILNGYPRDAFDVAANRTSNRAFKDSQLDSVVWEAPREVATEISWWRHGLMTTENPADALGYLFEVLIPAAQRKKHGQFRTPSRISQLMRELAICDGDQVLDAGMGAGALSVPRDQQRSSHIYGIEQSRLGFLLAVTALALTDQPGVVHEADFFEVGASTLGMNPDAAIGMGPDTGDVDVVPEQVDAAIGNPPYVANRNLDRETDYYRQHLSAFGATNQTPYLDGDKQLSGRSDLFVYFLTHATQFLTDRGRLVYLLPRKWMETRYGQTLQTFLLEHYKVSAVIDFDDTVFDDAQVEAVILVGERCADATARRHTSTRFITINKELPPTTISDLVTDGSETVAETGESNDRNSPREPGYQITTVRQSTFEERDRSDGPLSQYFREPDVLRSLKSNEMFVPLDTLASVTYGKKTGNNEFFLLNNADLDTWPLAERFYRTALADFGDTTGYRLTARDSETYMLDVHSYVESLDESGASGKPGDSRAQHAKRALARDGYNSLLAYLDHWEEMRGDEATQDDVWFDLGVLDAPDIVHPYRIHTEVRVSKNVDGLIPTNCAHNLDPKPGVVADVLLGYLNSTVHAAFVELWGQAEGGGSLEVTTGTLKQMPAADVQAFTEEVRDEVKLAYKALMRGEANAQTRLDNAVLDALDAEIDATTLREAKESLVHDRLPSN